MRHLFAVGLLGVAALYTIQLLYPSQLLYYQGPGSPYWLDEMLIVWHTVSGGMLGFGAVGLLWRWSGRLGGE